MVTYGQRLTAHSCNPAAQLQNLTESFLPFSTCILGQWTCSQISCSGNCTLKGGAHIHTYDEKEYTFHGNCQYLMSKVRKHVSGFKVKFNLLNLPSLVAPFSLINIQMIYFLYKTLSVFITYHNFRPSDVNTGSWCFSIQCKQIRVDKRGTVHSFLKPSPQPASVLLPRALSPDANSGLALGRSFANIKIHWCVDVSPEKWAFLGNYIYMQIALRPR